ncbi:MAG TPA: hypothetical protein VHM88_13225, partial [Candidatus Acidoferrales bacterium]|nr:hypothetical protein [Candidatus Acidoferrales bacterium]
PIDVEMAIEQHRRYEDCLRELGVSVVSLPAEPHLPDSTFVEDPAVVVREAAIMTRMGAESRSVSEKDFHLICSRTLSDWSHKLC